MELVPSGTERRSAVQPKMLHIGLCAVLLVNCLPNCADETRTPVVHIPSNGSEMPVAVAPIAREEPVPTPDVECLERGAGNELRFVDVIIPTYDLAAMSFVDANSRVQVIAARTWEPSPALRVGWIFGRVIVDQPNVSLQSFLRAMGRPTEKGGQPVALPGWIEEKGAWMSDVVSVLLYRTGIATALLSGADDLEALDANASDNVPINPASFWTLGDFHAIKLLDQKWFASSIIAANLFLAEYDGIVSFAPYAVELRDDEGSLGCAQVFNRRR